VLRRPLDARRAQAISSAVDQRRGAGHSRRHRLCRLADTGGRNVPRIHRRIGFESGRIAALEFGEGSLDALAIPGAVAIDRSYFDRLGVSGIGDSAEIRGHKVEVQAVTNGIRSFTTTPYVFTTLDRGRTYTGISANKATYFLVRVSPGADVETVRRGLKANLSDVDILTTAEFRDRSRSFWLFGTGAGFALFAGALLGIIVGTVIVAQTLYSSTKDHLNEFATLRAIGSSSVYIHKVIICQALISAVIGFCLAAGIGWIIVAATADTALPVVMTPTLTLVLFLLTIAMCVVSAIAAILQVTRIDPVTVFTR